MSKLSTVILAAALVAGSAAVSSADARDNRQRVTGPAAAARAQVPAQSSTSAPQSTAVYEWGKYQGQDPDPNVRLMLRKDVHN